MQQEKLEQEKSGASDLIGCFRPLEDKRKAGMVVYPLIEILVLTLCAVMAGAEGWEDIEDWGRHHEKWLRERLLVLNGIPGHDTIRRTFEMLEPVKFLACFAKWMAGICPNLENKILAIDGKTVRRASRDGEAKLHLVSAYISELGLSMGVVKTEEKSNEITAIPELLATLDLRGAIVTIDAMGCQKKIAEKIVDGKGHYVLAVKENQPTLLDNMERTFGKIDAGQMKRLIKNEVLQPPDKGHGRIETRQCTAIDVSDWPEVSEWTGLKTIARIKSTREIGDVSTTEIRYVISSLPTDAKKILDAVRLHWGTENGQHWCLDVAFREDACPIRLKNAAENFATIRRIALNLFRLDTATKKSLPKKRKIAAWNPDYLANVLDLQEI